jgi:Zn-dependent protease
LSTITHSLISTCPNCEFNLPLGSLACPQCHALVYSVRLEQLTRDARALEARGMAPQARELWATSLTLLPHDSRQAIWVQEHLASLAAAENALPQPATGAALLPAAPKEKAPPPNWVKKLGPFGPLALFLLKFKSAFFLLFKLKFLFSFLVFIWLYIALFGWRYGLGISMCILIHEMGHYVDVRRRGLPAEMPVFLPGFGAYVRWTGLGVSRRTIAQISLAGPLAGWIASAACYLIYAQTHDPIWAALARTGAFLNILNLIPVWVLDGGLAFYTLGVMERTGILAVSLCLWYYTGEGIFAFVALGTVWRIFTALSHREETRQQPDVSSWLYYVALLVALAVVLHAAPNTLASQGLASR